MRIRHKDELEIQRRKPVAQKKSEYKGLETYKSMDILLIPLSNTKLIWTRELTAQWLKEEDLELESFS